MKLEDQVAAHRGGLSPAEARVADFLLANPHSVGHRSALKLAAASGTSDATVVRTVHKLGFAGLDELREHLAAELSQAGRLQATVRAFGDGVVSRHVAACTGALTSLPERLSDEELAAALDVLAHAGRVVIVGFGPARHIASYTAQYLARGGVPSLAIGMTGRGFADQVIGLAAGDAAVLLSYDTPSEEVEVFYTRAGQLGVPVVQVTESRLVADPRAAVALGVGRGNPAYSPSHVPTLAVLEALADAVVATDPDRSARAAATLAELREMLS
ncbi:MurR/RpiR family transcriptional regulator [Corynebacterium nuruki]|uniref:MurR/RpiR family transcriptional regulator n=1 Tax=Corynebacterium nuruki TaxID=1032851 RepID=UPI0039BED95F